VRKETTTAEKKPEDNEEAIRTKAQGIAQRAQGAAGIRPKTSRSWLGNSAKMRRPKQGWRSRLDHKGDKRDTDDPLNRVFAMQKDENDSGRKEGRKVLHS